MYYLNTDSFHNVLSRQEIQKISDVRRDVFIGLAKYIIRQSIIENLGVEWAYYFYKEDVGYKAPERILRPTQLIINEDKIRKQAGAMFTVNQIIKLGNELTCERLIKERILYDSKRFFLIILKLTELLFLNMILSTLLEKSAQHDT